MEKRYAVIMKKERGDYRLFAYGETVREIEAGPMGGWRGLVTIGADTYTVVCYHEKKTVWYIV